MMASESCLPALLCSNTSAQNTASVNTGALSLSSSMLTGSVRGDSGEYPSTVVA